MKVKKVKRNTKFNQQTKKSKKITSKKKKDLREVTTDEFFAQDFDIDINSNEDEDKETHDYEDGNSSDSDMNPEEHKKSLMKLKDTDPEFYTYLKQNDKTLLDFDLSDDNNDDVSIEPVSESDRQHIPNEKLEVASDESDYEAIEDTEKLKDKGKVTLQLLKIWQEEIQTDKTSKTIKCAVEAFHAAVQSVMESPDAKSSRFKVEGGAVFNGVVQLCVIHLPAALKRFLKLGPETQFEAHKCKRFVKAKGIIKLYLTDLIAIFQSVTSSNILTVLLKHLHQMLPYAQSFSSLTKPLLRILLKLWSTAEENVRVVAFLNILRIATTRKESVLEMLLKAMYVSFVENAKFVSPTTLPGINFMRHSLTEIYLLDHNLSYNHAFLYIRQLAIHLRNAMTIKKKESFQAVYNWQYINSLRFWSELITLSKSQSMLRSLLYPLIQIIIGTIKLIPTAQYYPLRFHCVQMLINISRETNTFIPILPFLLEILNSYDFNKRHKTVSMKPISLICVLRMSKSQLQENGFKDSIIETIYQQILENAAKDSHMVYFPDLYVFCIIQLKGFLKNCHVANYCRKVKQLLEKIEENRKYIETERAKVTLDLKNTIEIANWENKIKTQGTALAKYYESWAKIHQSQKLKLLTKNEEVADYRLPMIRKSKKQEVNEGNEESDAESDFELTMKGEQTKRKQSSKRKKKKVSHTLSDKDEDDLPTENTDIVRDINSEDWD